MKDKVLSQKRQLEESLRKLYQMFEEENLSEAVSRKELDCITEAITSAKHALESVELTE